MISRFHYIVILLISIEVSIGIAGPVEAIDEILLMAGISPVGTAQIRAGSFDSALTRLKNDTGADTTTVSVAYRTFKTGIAHYGLGQWDEALSALTRAAGADRHLAPVAWELVGDVELARGKPIPALTAYRTAVSSTSNTRYRDDLYLRMRDVAQTRRSEVGPTPWLDTLLRTAPEHIRGPGPCDSLMERCQGKSGAALDNILQPCIDTEKPEPGTCSACSTMLKAGMDSLFSSRQRYRMSEVALICGALKNSSDWLHQAIDCPDFAAVVPQGKYLFHRAELNYRLRNYGNAIKWFRLYEERHGPTAPLVYMVARSYRALGNARKMGEWYNRHIELYPQSSRTLDIIWYRAWQEEERGAHRSARSHYVRLFTQYRRGGKAEEARYRYGLSWFRESMHDSALVAFNECIKTWPGGTMAPGARYWKARTFHALDMSDSARKAYRDVIASSPFDYYAFRSSRMLTALADTVVPFVIDTAGGTLRAATWLDSLTAGVGKAMTSDDSAVLNMAHLLAATGLGRQVDFLLEPVEIAYPGNLDIQYRIALLHSACNNPAAAFRAGRRLSWRIPVEFRSSMPHAVVRAMYPALFGDIISRYALANDLPPSLVSAVIRQESIFNPSIVSPAGAVGLMQIMPFTGRSLSRSLGETFATDSLYNPELNIRYGTYYLRRLLNQFDGHIMKSLAGYNGGPHNVKRWFADGDSRGFDLMVEDVGFAETRGYVKKVLANYWTYQLLETAEGRTRPVPLLIDGR